MKGIAFRAALLGLALAAGSVNANVPAWGDRMRAMLAKQEAVPVQPTSPASNGVTLAIGTNGALIAMAPAPVAEQAAVEAVSAVSVSAPTPLSPRP